MNTISIIGLGFVGGAMKKSFEIKGCNVYGYDKYKESDSFEECLKGKIIFLALPTIYDETKKEYDKSCIEDVCDKLMKNNYNGIIVNKSTVEPKTTLNLARKYNNLKLVHNPEFLSAATAFDDFHQQNHIVLGKTDNISDNEFQELKNFYTFLYPNAEISLCDSIESESMKIFVNCFYSVKIQFFNELFLLCQKHNANYEIIKNLMLKNGWINPMHTNVPGNDGKLSYGGYCFPKDTNALLQHMKLHNSPCKVLESTIDERNTMRDDIQNIKS